MQWNGEFLAFFLLSVMAIGGAVFMIHFTRVVHMVLALAFTFLSIAGIYVLLHAEFVAAVQVLIYTGAVSILMLFGIMLTKHRTSDHSDSRSRHQLLSFVGVAAFFGVIMWVIYHTPFSGGKAETAKYTVANLGEWVFKQYVIPFELTSVLLLAALVGAVILAKKERDA
ncbi:NADH:ubiquinone oxidoreductase subunit J [Marinithermofilum abyssi]|uniref:NADH-quinone oxidoreductase subunit J n=1 Tax=Marinithermofilum abyssi TaxID=1571185 RepID=A0A8J2VF47_9BACL|nr:NADH-quinone oxidoreductase subunit J [Marinithermofilum abyssi]GGE05168.1 NADH:ubiquinone oxidoreductase subunit J [Marinithermofilum abyssi]